MDKIEQLYNLYVGKGLISRDKVTIDMFRAANQQQREQLFSLGRENNLFSVVTLEQFNSAWSPAVDKKKDDTGSISEGGSLEPVETAEQQAERARSLRSGTRKNPDGTESTVRMAWGEADGRYVAYPTLFQDESGSWYESSTPFEEARSKGELFFFDSEDAASKFAGGSWKGSAVDESELNLEIPEMVDPEDEGQIAAARRRVDSDIPSQSTGQYSPYSDPYAEWYGQRMPTDLELEMEPNKATGKSVYEIRREEEQRKREQEKEQERLAGIGSSYRSSFDVGVEKATEVPELEEVTYQFANRREERVVPELRDRFGKYGFKFRESGVGRNEVTVTSPNGEEQSFPLKDLVSLPTPQEGGGYGYFNKDVERSVGRLRSFIAENAMKYSMPEFAEQPEEPLTIADEAFMRYAEEEGLDPMASLKNVRSFKLLKERTQLMQGIVEGGDAFVGRMVETNPDLVNKHPDIFSAPEAVVSEMLRQERTELKALSRGDVAGLNFDEYQRIDEKLAKERDEQRDEAISRAEFKKLQLKDLNYGSISEFGVPIQELATYAESQINAGNLTPQQVLRVNEYLKAYGDTYVDATTALQTANLVDVLYSKSMLYEDTRYEFVNELRGVQNAWNDGINRGEAGMLLLKLQLGLKDSSDDDVLEALTARFGRMLEPRASSKGAEYVARRRALSDKSGTGQFLESAMSGKGFAFLVQTAAGSLSQMLPPGKAVFPMAIGGGAAIGGAVGGPEGALAGAARGGQLASGLTGFLVEYNSAVIDAALGNGFNVRDPKEWEAALNDASVWRDARELGIKRGLAIGLVDLVTASLAGRVLTVGKTASVAARARGAAAEQFLLEMPSESLGEYTAQVVAGQDVDMYEVLMEGAAGVAGPQPVNAALNILYDTYKQRSGALAKSLMDFDGIMDVPDNAKQIASFADRQVRDGVISVEDATRIKEKAAAIEEAESLVSDMETGNRPSGEERRDVVIRLAELIEAKKKYDLNPSAYKNKIAAVKQEMSEIVDTGKIPDDKTEIADAIQKPSTESVDVRQQARDGKEVAKEDRQEEVAETPVEEEVAEAVDATQEDEEAFRAGELDAERTNGIAMRIAEKEASGELLTPFEVEFAAANTDVVDKAKSQLYDVTVLEGIVQEQATPTPPTEPTTPAEATTEPATAEPSAPEPAPEDAPVSEPSPAPEPAPAPEPQAEADPLFDRAVDHIESGGKPTNVAIRKALGISYKKAKRILQKLEDNGLVTKPDSRGRREVASTEQEIREFKTRRVSGVSIQETRETTEVSRVSVSRKPVAEEVAEIHSEPQDPTVDDPITEQLPEVSDPQKDEDMGAALIDAAELTPEEEAAIDEAMPENTQRRVTHVATTLAKADEKKVRQYLSGLSKPLASAIGKILRSLWTWTASALIGLSLYVNADVERAVRQAVSLTPTPLIEYAINRVLPDEQAQMLNRIAVQGGKIQAVETKMEFIPIKSTRANVAPDSTEPSFFQKIASTRDGLWSFRSQWSADSGFVYIAMPNRDNRGPKGRTASARGVAHFLLDADISGGSTYSHPHNIALHRINKENNGFVPVFERLEGDRVRLTYKRHSEVSPTDGIAAPLRQYRFGDIDFSRHQRAEGFRSANEVVLRDGVKNPYTKGKGTYLIFTGSKDNYGKFSGGGVVFIWEHNGKRYVRDFAGSVNQIQAEGRSIVSQYGINPNDLTMGYHDLGSFSAKPEAYQGEVSTWQYHGYNPYGWTGGALLIPHSQRSTSAEVVLDMTQAFEAAVAAYGPAFDIGSFVDMTSTPTSPTAKFRVGTELAGSSMSESADALGGLTMTDAAMHLSGNDLKLAQKLIKGLNRLLPFVQITMDRASFNNAIAQESTREVVRDGRVVYGIAKGGHIFINPDVHTDITSLSNTLVHEVSHVWMSALRTTERGQRILSRGIALAKKTDRYRALLEVYPDADVAAEETLAELIGDKGSQIVNQVLSKEFSSWLDSLWDFVKTRFKAIRGLSNEQVQSLTLNEFIDAAAADILSGKDMELSAEQQSIVEGRLTAMFSAGDKLSSRDIESIIETGRVNGFPDGVIKAMLKRRGVQVSVINELMRIEAGMVSSVYEGMAGMPPEFGNVRDGALIGSVMFFDSMQAVQEYASTEVDGSYPTNESVRKEAIEILSNHRHFQKQDAVTQKRLLVAFDKAIKKPTIHRITEIEKIKRDLKERSSAVADIKNIRDEVLGLVKALVPASKMSGYKSLITNLMSLVSSINEDNAFVRYEEIMEVIESIGSKISSTEEKNKAKTQRLSEQIDNLKAKLESKRDVINNLRQTAKEQRIARYRLRNLIRRLAPEMGSFSKSDIDKMVRSIDNAKPSNFANEADKVLVVIDRAMERLKRKTINELYAYAKSQRKSSALSADDKLYFASVARVLRASARADVDDMLKLATALSIETDRNKVDEAVGKFSRGERLTPAEKKIVVQEEARERLANGEELTTEQKEFIYLEQAFDEFGDITMLDALEVVKLFEDIKAGRGMVSSSFATVKVAEALEMIEMRENMRIAAQSKLPDIYTVNEDGDLIIKNKNELEMSRRKVARRMEATGYTKGFESWYSKIVGDNTITAVKGLFNGITNNSVTHLGTLCKLMDGKNSTFFTDNIYRQLNRDNETFLRGRRQTKKRLDAIADNITGTNKGMDAIVKLEPKGKVLIKGKGGKEYALTSGEAMRVYALSLNPGQKRRLDNMGITNDKISQIRSYLGQDIVNFVEDVTHFLGTEYYEGINSVYSAVNHAHLRREQNYFPTVSAGITRKKTEFADEEFSGRFSNEYSPLQERKALESEPQIVGKEGDLGSLDFFDVLLQHTNTMERYKAYAHTTKKLNTMFSGQDAAVFFGDYGLGNANLVRQLISHAINGAKTGVSTSLQNVTSKVFARLTGIYLGYKLVQIAKQASSFINAFEAYSFRGDKKRLDKLGISDTVIDFFGFAMDTAIVFLQLPKYIKLAREVSATFDDRMTQGFQGGDFYGLESGSPYSVISPSKRNPNKNAIQKVGGFVSNLRKWAGYTTIIGDILGVMGYMVNYRRDVKNGMQKERAVEKFNDYNETQQTRRGTERALIQQEKNVLVRGLTMFASVPFLQLNKVMQSTYGVVNSMRNGEVPSKQDIRSFVINGFLANAFFQFTANLAKFAMGDDEDRREAYRRAAEAGAFSIVFRIPLFGAAVETAYHNARGDTFAANRVKSTINPYNRIVQEVSYSIEKDGDFTELFETSAEVLLGFEVDPAQGIVNLVSGSSEETTEELWYDILGISEYYQPDE